jgi:hypothetical protein
MWYDRESAAHVRHFFVEQIIITKSQIIVGYFHFRESEEENMKNSYFIQVPLYCLDDDNGINLFSYLCSNSRSEFCVHSIVISLRSAFR